MTEEIVYWKKLRIFAPDLVIQKTRFVCCRQMKSSFLAVKRELGESPEQSRCCELQNKPQPRKGKESHCVSARHMGRRAPRGASQNTCQVNFF